MVTNGDFKPTDAGMDFDTWRRIRNTFTKAGFSPAEATWAANNNLDPRDLIRGEQIKRMLMNRMRRYRVLKSVSDKTREEVIDFLAQRRVDDLRARGVEDPENLFIGDT